jgi:hypothetical protein
MWFEKVIKSIVNVFLRWALFLHLLLAISSWEKEGTGHAGVGFVRRW